MTAFILLIISLIVRLYLCIFIYRNDVKSNLNIISLAVIFLSTLFFLVSLLGGINFPLTFYKYHKFIYFTILPLPLLLPLGVFVLDLAFSFGQLLRVFRSKYSLEIRLLRIFSFLLFGSVFLAFALIALSFS